MLTAGQLVMYCFKIFVIFLDIFICCNIFIFKYQESKNVNTRILRYIWLIHIYKKDVLEILIKHKDV